MAARALVAAGCAVGAVLAAGAAWGLTASTGGQDISCHIDDQNVLSCPLPPPPTVTATETQTVPGPTTTVPGPTTTVPGPTTTVTVTPTPTTPTPTPTPTPTGGGSAPGEAVNATNTGLAGAGVSAGSLTADPTTTYGASFNGQTISGKLYTHRVNITGDNITIRDCEVTTGGANSFGIDIAGNNDTVDHCLIVPPAGKSYYEPVFINPKVIGAAVTYNDISGGENLLTSYGAGTVAHNYMHGASTVSDPSGHPDGIEIYGGGPLLVEGNRIVEGSLYDSPINAAPYGSYTLTDLTVSDNFLDNGQGMMLIDNQNSGGFIRNTRVLRNVMGGHTNPDTGNSFGRYKALENYDGRPAVQTEAQLAANPNAILWPTSGPDTNHWGECSDLTPDRTGQIVIPA